MDTRLLKTFRAVAKHGGLGGAARELCVSASALSHSLKALETEVGCRLFDRTGGRLVLNQAGEQLLAGVEGPLVAIDRAAEQVRALRHWGLGRLRVGASAGLCAHVLPAVWRELSRDFPRLQFQLETGSMPELLGRLRDRRLDLAVGLEPEGVSDVETRVLFEDELFFVHSVRHPWGDGRALTGRDLEMQPLILYRRDGATAELIRCYFQRQSVQPNVTMALASFGAIKEMVRHDLGVSILAPWTVEWELARGQLKARPLGGKALRRRWVVAHLASRRLDLAEEVFCRSCRIHTTPLRKDRRDLPADSRESGRAI